MCKKCSKLRERIHKRAELHKIYEKLQSRHMRKLARACRRGERMQDRKYKGQT